MKMAYMVAGGEEAYRKHPFLTHHYCPVVSPLTMDKLSTENVMYFAKEGLPVYPTIVPNAGLTSPMSMAGSVPYWRWEPDFIQNLPAGRIFF